MEEDNKNNMESAKNWLQENLRIIISIIIVIAIAGGIYSYSKRSPVTTITEETGEEVVSLDDLKKDEGAITEESAEKKEEAKSETPQKKVAPEATSQETDKSFIETAGKGNGVTHLARRALANYLEKNPDSELKAEQKIYIEDYLRKKVGHKGGVFVGTSVEFSKDLIKEAIEKSKGLSESQIKNLHKYVVLVPSLS